MPDVPQPRVRRGGDRDGQVERDEHHDPQRRRVRGAARPGAVQDRHLRRQARHHGYRVCLMKYLDYFLCNIFINFRYYHITFSYLTKSSRFCSFYNIYNFSDHNNSVERL